jgi:5-enolpyruvylshikimate-3-phosphate synthase
MAFLIFGLGTMEPITISRAQMIGTSFPGFAKLMRSLGAEIHSC